MTSEECKKNWTQLLKLHAAVIAAIAASEASEEMKFTAARIADGIQTESCRWLEYAQILEAVEASKLPNYGTWHVAPGATK